MINILMKSFKEYIDNTDFVDFVINEFDNVAQVASPQIAIPQPASSQAVSDVKPWSATKKEVLAMWRNIRPDIPIIIQPMKEKVEGSDRSSYGEDGIRITGTWNFISSVLGRLKDIITYENPKTRLRLIFRSVEKSGDPRPDKQTFVFYINMEKRGSRRRGRPKNLLNLTPQIPKS